MRKSAAVLSIFGLVLAVSGCSGSEASPEPAPTTSVTSASPNPEETETEAEPEAEPLAPGTVVVDREYLNIPVRLEIAPLQVSDGVALLSVDYSLAEGAPEGASVAFGRILAPVAGPVGVGLTRLIDGEHVLLVGRDGTDQPVTTREQLRVSKDTRAHSDALFAAPTGTSVDVLLPYLGLVQDVPVEPAADGLAVSPVDLGRSGDITYDSAQVDSFSVAFEESSSSRVTGKDATVSLSSDVLFDVDEFQLTKSAKKTVDAAAKEMLKTAEAGEVTVVGHTDDVASAQYNQKLSVKRAKSVAGRLSKTLGSDFKVKSEGRGKDDPVAEGTSKQARAENRRVEIDFQTQQAGAAVDVGDAEIEVPKAAGAVASADESVSVTVLDRDYTINVESVERRGGHVVGSLRVTSASGGRSKMFGLFGDVVQGRTTGRGIKNLTLSTGAHNLTLLGQGSRIYPADYLLGDDATGEDRRAPLTDQVLAVTLDEGESILVTAIWPDPGGDTVTIDALNRFRFTDVPVISGDESEGRTH